MRPSQKDNGYLMLFRKIQDHPFYKERRQFSKLEAWIDILFEVRYSEEPEDVMFGMKVISCGYGESLNSIMTWAKRWKWSESKVRRFFILLEKLNQIEVKSEGQTTRLTVLNYSKYNQERRASGKVLKDERRASDEQVTTEEEGKKEKKGNNIKKPAKKKSFSPPTVEEVESYFVEKGYLKTAGEKAWEYYNAGNWKDAGGKPVLSWKQKMTGVWFKDENKTSVNGKSFKPKTQEQIDKEKRDALL